ncbi:MAG: hypothetical protein ACI4EG_05485 [Fusicatenibacter sp.]
MGNISLQEQGYRFVRSCFRAFGGNTDLLALFLLAFLFLAVKGKQKEKYIFVYSTVFLGVTVYNPLIVKPVIGKLGMTTVYYRFFWILPMVLLMAYCCVKLLDEIPKGKKRSGVMIALVLIIWISGDSVISDGIPKVPENQYKVADDLLNVCAAIHEDTEKEYPKAVFENEFNLFARQYDGSILLTLDRDIVLLSQGSTTVSTRGLSEEEIEDQNTIIGVIYQTDLSIDASRFMQALYDTETDYVVISAESPVREYVENAGCSFCRQTQEHIIYRVGQKGISS